LSMQSICLCSARARVANFTGQGRP
jgi:hypothetical protein